MYESSGIVGRRGSIPVPSSHKGIRVVRESLPEVLVDRLLLLHAEVQLLAEILLLLLLLLLGGWLWCLIHPSPPPELILEVNP